jgi:hypothetical protein
MRSIDLPRRMPVPARSRAGFSGDGVVVCLVVEAVLPVVTGVNAGGAPANVEAGMAPTWVCVVRMVWALAAVLLEWAAVLVVMGAVLVVLVVRVLALAVAVVLA